MFKSFALIVALVNSIWGAPQSGQLVDGRIVGGTNATIEAYPYIVSVLQNDYHSCGGSIISVTWILSAAHCFELNVSSYSIRTGSSTRNAGGQVIAARRILIHDSYSLNGYDFDIALIELVSPITITNARAIAMVAEGDVPVAGTTATITGWGAVSEGGPRATTLQVIQVPVISQADCRAAYGQNAVTERMFCAGLLGVGGKDSCQSDSGGPLVANGVLTGVVSWGFGCARPDAPGVYASIPNLRSWIRDNSGV